MQQAIVVPSSGMICEHVIRDRSSSTTGSRPSQVRSTAVPGIIHNKGIVQFQLFFSIFAPLYSFMQCNTLLLYTPVEH